MIEEVDVVVVGAGAMGTAAAWHVAAAGRDVVVLEQFAEGHTIGASHGSTRNITAAYADDVYQGMLRETRALWAQLESESGQTLIDRVGLVHHGAQGPLHAIRDAHRRHEIASEFLAPEDAGERWPGLRFAGPVLYTREAGRIRASDALRVVRARAEASGAQFRFETTVRGIEPQLDAVTVHVDGGTIRARRAIVTAGAWTRKIVPGDITLPALRVTQEQPAHFAERAGERTWPGFMQSPEPGDRDAWWASTVYGMRTPGEGIKVGWHGSGPVTDPDARTFTYEPGQMDRLRRYVSEWVPGADPDRFEAISCTYTTTPTEDFILDRVGPIVIGAGFSGHGFKFTPVVGRILADLARDVPAPRTFRIDRVPA
ncbi:FAD-dependent oxidoreductase [Microbacterium sp. RD1]|uniref:FAD-dependent oxidoreductase n=1 Tax=Microbacterium sp. RD1 TaxID=3457313 RepID=UPI003FA5CE38